MPLAKFRNLRTLFQHQNLDSTIVLEPVVWRLDSAIYQVVIFLTAVKRLEKQWNFSCDFYLGIRRLGSTFLLAISINFSKNSREFGIACLKIHGIANLWLKGILKRSRLSRSFAHYMMRPKLIPEPLAQCSRADYLVASEQGNIIHGTSFALCHETTCSACDKKPV